MRGRAAGAGGWCKQQLLAPSADLLEVLDLVTVRCWVGGEYIEGGAPAGAGENTHHCQPLQRPHDQAGTQVAVAGSQLAPQRRRACADYIGCWQ